MTDDKFNVFDLITVKNQRNDEKVHKTRNLGKIADYVFDIEAEAHDFTCGFPLIVHNTDILVFSVNTKINIKVLKNLEDLFDFSKLNKNHELYNDKNRKVIGKFKIETPKNFWIDECICLRSKVYSFKCGDDIKIKLKRFSISQSKHIKFEDYKKCLNGEEYQRECKNYIVKSIDHETYLQQLKKLFIICFWW